MPVARPPIRSVPLFARCPACGKVLRVTLDFRQAEPATVVWCPWCRQQVTVTMPE